MEGALLDWCVEYAADVFGVKLKKQPRFISYYIIKSNNLGNHLLDSRGSKLRFWYIFTFDIPLIAVVIAKAALYWIE